MKLMDLKIRTQLRLGLGLILAFVIFLGAVSWIQSNQLWSQTESIYSHPLQVSRAVGLLQAGTHSISRAMRDLMLAENDQEVTRALQDIEVCKSDVSRQFEIINNRYLGPRDNITALEKHFADWNVFHDETIRLFRTGNKRLALTRTKASSSRGGTTETLVQQIATINEFARIKGNEFFQAANERNKDLKRQLITIVTTILLISLFVSWLLVRGIKEPLTNLTKAAEQFRLGELDSRSKYTAANEFGVLSATFNEMAETVETQMFINEQAARLAGVMLRETEARSFCRELIKELVGLTGSQIGAVYLLNPQKTAFEHFESIGLSEGGRSSFSAELHEGEFGAALATGKMQRITDIPEDTQFTFVTVQADYTPREIITLPLISEEKVVAIISLSSIRRYEGKTIRLLETTLTTLTARMNGVMAFRQIQDMASRLDRQNQELTAQQQELVAQADELTHQNSALELQKKQLDAANRLKSTFLSNMSHELRTPLNSVIALSSVLGRRLAKKIPEEEFDYLEVIERNGRHLLALINDILDLSRVESGRIDLNPANFSLKMLINEVVEMIDPQAQEKGIVLSNNIDASLPKVTTDPDKFRHIVQNLISNAVKFTDVGSVEVSAELADDQIHLTVRDTGIGITSNSLPRIFEEFRQADEGTSRRYGGTGLGLAIAKKYANFLLGDITVDSTPGVGSTFTLTLPLSLPPGRVSERYIDHKQGETVNRQDLTDGRGKCILLVEDSEPAVIQVTDILSEHGYRVEVARDGSDALAYVEGCLPDAVILDLMMPGIDGFEVLRQIRGTDRTAPLPVLILTAKHVTSEELSFLTGNNIHQLVQKGDIGKNQLLEMVAKMVASSRQESASPPAGDRPLGALPVALVVEDNPDNLKTAKALLKERCKVITAEDGQAAILEARLHLPDLILTDLALPLMDGFEVLTAIRNDEALRHIPVVAVTASAMKGDQEKILAHGFNGYISKPIDSKVLMQTLDEVLAHNE